jgi:type I restriction enzyme S subunit
VQIPLPPIDDQLRIVAAIEEQFSRLDAGVAALQSSWTKLRLMRRALLHSAVTGKLIGATTDGWKIATLGELVTDIHAGKSFKCEERPAQPDEWGVIKVSAMTWGEFLERENKTVLPGREIDMRMEIREGDLLVSRANTVDYVGAVVLVRKTRPRLLLSDKSLRLLLSSAVLPEWLVITLRSPDARRYIEGVATGTSDSMRNISQPKLRALQVPLPPIDVQRELIAEVARQSAVIAELDSAIKRQLTRADRLRSSILADAYAGRLASLEPSDRSPAQLQPPRPDLAGPDGQRVAANHLVKTGDVA